MSSHPFAFSIPPVLVIAMASAWAQPIPAQAQAQAQVQAPPREAAFSMTIAPQTSSVRLDLEGAVSRADLIMVVRLADVTEAKIVYGGKTETVTQQFRLTPVKVLKGIFARDALLMTDGDLGVGQYGGGSGLEKGQLFLILLGRRGPGFFNCNSADSLEQSIPRLDRPDDPLLGTVETLIGVTQQRDRAKSASAIVKGLQTQEGRAAVPLLLALQRRAILAAQTPGAARATARSLTSPNLTIRETAAQTLTAVLQADYLQQRELRESALAAILQALDDPANNVRTRVELLRALGAVGESARDKEPARVALSLDKPSRTFQEQAARLEAIGSVKSTAQRDAVASALDAMPLDGPDQTAHAAVATLAKLDPAEAAKHLSARIAAKHDAGLPIAAEIRWIGDLPREHAVPLLLETARRPLDFASAESFAIASLNVSDPRLVPPLAGLINPRLGNIRLWAIEALRKIDTPEAARAVWPRLREESDLHRKLILAAFLGKHGFPDGYPFAIEHMSDPNLRDVAVKALAAIREPKAIAELRKIWETSNDVEWNSAAIRALGALGQADIAPKLLEIAKAFDEPLAAPALIALGDLGEVKALPILRDALNSRSDAVVVAAIRSARELLNQPAGASEDIRNRLAKLATDRAASAAARTEAFDALESLKDRRLGPALSLAVRDAGLENQELMRKVEGLLIQHRVPLNLQTP